MGIDSRWEGIDSWEEEYLRAAVRAAAVDDLEERSRAAESPSKSAPELKMVRVLSLWGKCTLKL